MGIIRGLCKGKQPGEASHTKPGAFPSLPQSLWKGGQKMRLLEISMFMQAGAGWEQMFSQESSNSMSTPKILGFFQAHCRFTSLCIWDRVWTKTPHTQRWHFLLSSGNKTLFFTKPCLLSRATSSTTFPSVLQAGSVLSSTYLPISTSPIWSCHNELHNMNPNWITFFASASFVLFVPKFNTTHFWNPEASLTISKRSPNVSMKGDCSFNCISSHSSPRIKVLPQHCNTTCCGGWSNPALKAMHGKTKVQPRTDLFVLT